MMAAAAEDQTGQASGREDAGAHTGETYEPPVPSAPGSAAQARAGGAEAPAVDVA